MAFIGNFILDDSVFSKLFSPSIGIFEDWYSLQSTITVEVVVVFSSNA